MENKDLGSKKMNGKQNVNEGFIGKNNDKNPSAPELTADTEIDTEGNKKIVQRVQSIDGEIPILPTETFKNQLDKED